MMPARIVYVRIEFIRVGEIDTMNEKYNAEICIESKWIDEYTSFEGYNAEKDWNPKLYIENVLQIQKEKIQYKIMKQNGELWITETRLIKGFNNN